MFSKNFREMKTRDVTTTLRAASTRKIASSGADSIRNAKPLLPLLYARDRDDHLGRAGRAVEAPLRLRADEGAERRPADEVDLDNRRTGQGREAFRQAPDAEARCAAQSDPAGEYAGTGPGVRSVLRQRNHGCGSHRTPSQVRGVRAGTGIRRPRGQPPGGCVGVAIREP